jgi:hypothetical protein
VKTDHHLAVADMAAELPVAVDTAVAAEAAVDTAVAAEADVINVAVEDIGAEGHPSTKPADVIGKISYNFHQRIINKHT